MFKWNEEKNLELVARRGVSFYDAVEQIKNKGILDSYKHPKSEKYPNQYIYVIRLHEYIHYVPYVYDGDDGDDIFLKNIITSSQLNKIYKKDKK